MRRRGGGVLATQYLIRYVEVGRNDGSPFLFNHYSFSVFKKVIKDEASRAAGMTVAVMDMKDQEIRINIWEHGLTHMLIIVDDCHHLLIIE